MQLVEKLRQIHHITQPDPANENPDYLLELIGRSGTDCIIPVGSGGYDQKGLLEILKRLQIYAPQQKKFVAAYHPSLLSPEVTKEIFLSPKPPDGILVYDVMNSPSAEFSVGYQKLWHRMYLEKNELPPSSVAEMGYIVMTTTGTIKKIVPLDEDLSINNIVSYACVAARRHPIIYLETTGLEEKIEPSEYLREIRRRTTEIGYPDVFIISGGRIRTEEGARKRIKSGADAINVGDPLYEGKEGLEAWLSTIRGVKPEISREYHQKLIEELFPK